MRLSKLYQQALDDKPIADPEMLRKIAVIAEHANDALWHANKYWKNDAIKELEVSDCGYYIRSYLGKYYEYDEGKKYSGDYNLRNDGTKIDPKIPLEEDQYKLFAKHLTKCLEEKQG
jgi:hypothetical protein